MISYFSLSNFYQISPFVWKVDLDWKLQVAVWLEIVLMEMDQRRNSENVEKKISFAQRKIKVNKRCWANSVYIVSPKFTPIIRPGAKVWWQYRNSFTWNRQLVRHGSVCMFFFIYFFVILNHHFVLFNSQSPLICLKDRLAFSQVYIKLTEFIGLILKT